MSFFSLLHPRTGVLVFGCLVEVFLAFVQIIKFPVT